LQAIEFAHGATEEVAMRLHGESPGTGIDVQTMHDWGKMFADSSVLAFSASSSGPIKQREIVVQREWDPGRARSCGVVEIH
jgi:hypothetical protein